MKIKKEIIKYDENNNIIYTKRKSGLEIWYEYDENGNEIHYKNSSGRKNADNMIKIIMKFIVKILMDLNLGMNMT